MCNHLIQDCFFSPLLYTVDINHNLQHHVIHAVFIIYKTVHSYIAYTMYSSFQKPWKKNITITIQ